MSSATPTAATPAKPHSIARYAQGHDNNFNIVRMVAASLVVLTHAYGFTNNGDLEPLKRVFNISFGSWAVNVFFAISGFLVCKSWHRDPSAKRFLWARAVRIYPALWVCIALCALAMGPWFTTLPLASYFSNPELFRFLAANSTLLPKGVMTSLPGVFDGNSVNSPLWTLPYELKMYLGLLVLGATGVLFRRGVLPVVVVVSLAAFAWGVFALDHEAALPQYGRFVFSFFLGAWLFAQRERVSFNFKAALAMVAVVAASVAWADTPWRLLLLTVVTPYLSLYLALVPRGLVRAYNRLGDYSYGIYIYGAPIQLIVLQYSSDKSNYLFNFFASYLVVFAVAAASWHLIEKHALRLKMRK